MRRRRSWLTGLVVLFSIAALVVYAAWPGRTTFTISPETTVVTGPLDPRGFVDYETALNQRLSEGVTPANNANVLIWQVLGPHPEGGTMPAEYFQWLGIEQPPENGDYLIPWHQYLKDKLKDHFRDQSEPFNRRMFRAQKWPWSTASEPELAEWLRRNEKPLALLIEATRRREYYNPIVPKRAEDGSAQPLTWALLPSVQKCRELAMALACRAMLRVHEGKVEEAWQDLLACHRLGRLVGRGGTIIESLVGIAVDVVASQADLAFLDRAKLTAEQLRTCLQDLRRLPPMPGLADKLDLSERFVILETMNVVARRGWPALKALSGNGVSLPKDDDVWGRLFMQSIDWDPALRNANHWYDRCVEATLLPDRAARQREWTAIVTDIKALKQKVSGLAIATNALVGPAERGETLGNILICLLLPAVEKVQGAADRQEQVQANLHLAFALAAYQRDCGRYPAQLDELAPKYVEKVPNDVFSGKALIYKPAADGYLLYSVGLNGTDDAGRGLDDEPRGDDISIRMPVPKGER